MMQLLKRLHKWVGLLIGVQVLLWLSSGLVISLLDPVKVSGRQWALATLAEPQFIGPTPLLEPAELAAEHMQDAIGIELTIRHGKPVYVIRNTDGETLISGNDGSIITFEKADAEKLARQDFSGDGEIMSIAQGMAPDMETRKHSGVYWRVGFSDKANTAIYIAASTGKILERRNSYWRVRDFFWMLHIMDYSGRQNFYHPLIISVALVAIWLGITGFLLLFRSFSRNDFFFLRFPGKRDDVVITLIDPLVGEPQQVMLRRGSKLFLSLAMHGVSLPSICGGGGECGKCRVRFENASLPEASGIELLLVPKSLREKGYRLACQQIAENNMTLHLREGTLTPPG